MKKRTKHPESLMVWGWFNYQGMGQLVWVEGTVDSKDYIEILDEYLPLNDDFIFLQDGASVHTAKAVDNWLEQNNIDKIENFPGYSPDLNPIEHVWGDIKRHLKASPAKDKEDLWKKICVIWNGMSLEYIHGLVESMPRRLEAVKQAKRLY